MVPLVVVLLLLIMIIISMLLLVVVVVIVPLKSERRLEIIVLKGALHAINFGL